MTRHFTSAVALTLVAVLICFDQASAQLNPYKAPPLLAIGSGVAASGGFCGALPQ